MIIYFVIILAVISRFIPHMPNFAPITALAIFAAANMGWKKAVGITLSVRLVSDIFLGFVSWPMMLAIYLSHLTGVLFGVWIKSSASVTSEAIPQSGKPSGAYKTGFRIAPGGLSRMTGKKWVRVIISSLGASMVFFFVTNFAFLYESYPHNFFGIVQSYSNGLPFLKGTIAGDMFYSACLFGGYELAKILLNTKLFAKEILKLKAKN